MATPGPTNQIYSMFLSILKLGGILGRTGLFAVVIVGGIVNYREYGIFILNGAEYHHTKETGIETNTSGNTMTITLDRYYEKQEEYFD